MPTYDYECLACEHTFEKFQSITAPSIRKCPKCKKLKVHRLIGTGAGIIFKGSGFYQTDYRSEAYRKDADKDKKAASDAGKSAKDTKAKSDSPKSDSPKGDSPKSDSPKGDSPKSDSPKGDSSKPKASGDTGSKNSD